jgi:septal ring factor EnvC (AmiA/AmiB activator)
MKDEAVIIEPIIAQTPPLPDGTTPVERLLLWCLGVAVIIISYFYRALETKNARHIEEMKEMIAELKHDLRECTKEHEKAEAQFAVLRAEMKAIQDQRYKTT